MAPFFYSAQFEHAQELFTVDFDTFLELAAQVPEADTLIFVHNIGRCGSTLLSKAFSRLDSCTSYSEPDCFTQIAYWRILNDPRDELWRALLPACMKFVFRDAHAPTVSRHCQISQRLCKSHRLVSGTLSERKTSVSLPQLRYLGGILPQPDWPAQSAQTLLRATRSWMPGTFTPDVALTR